MNNLDLRNEWPGVAATTRQSGGMVILIGARPKPEAAAAETGWTFTRILKYTLGGAVMLLLGGWVIKNRERIALESRTVRRLGTSLAGRAKGVVAGAKAERQSIRQEEQQRQQQALFQKRVRALEEQLRAAQQRAARAQAPVDRLQSQLAGLRQG